MARPAHGIWNMAVGGGRTLDLLINARPTTKAKKVRGRTGVQIQLSSSEGHTLSHRVARLPNSIHPGGLTGGCGVALDSGGIEMKGLVVVQEAVIAL